jgi:hypothetical protein
MRQKRVPIRRVRTSDLIAVWKICSPFKSVAFGPNCGPPKPEVADRDAVWLRYIKLSLQYPGVGEIPVWCRYVVFLIAAKLPFALDVMADSAPHFSTHFS